MTGHAGRIGRRAALLATALAGAVPAAAQGREAGSLVDDVNSRARPEYDAAGIRLGGLTVRPQLAASVAYDDNIFRTGAARRSDTFATLAPRIRIESRSPRYPVTLDASATLRRYARTGTEDSEQYALSATAAADLFDGIRLSARAARSRALEPRGTAGDLFVGGEPIAYDLTQARGSIMRAVGRIAVEASGAYARYSYSRARVNGASLDQSFRDYRVAGGHLKLAYGVTPAVAAFVTGAIDRNVYPRSRDTDRGSRTYSVIAGVDLSLGSLIGGSIGFGYVREDFVDPAFADVSGLDYAIGLRWAPTPLVTVALSGERSLSRSPFVGSAGGVERSLDLAVDYELLRQLILSADISRDEVRYRGLVRRDRRTEARLGARYLVGRGIGLTTQLHYRRQDSAGLAARNFDGFGASIGVTLQR